MPSKICLRRGLSQTSKHPAPSSRQDTPPPTTMCTILAPSQWLEPARSQRRTDGERKHHYRWHLRCHNDQQLEHFLRHDKLLQQELVAACPCRSEARSKVQMDFCVDIEVARRRREQLHCLSEAILKGDLAVGRSPRTPTSRNPRHFNLMKCTHDTHPLWQDQKSAHVDQMLPIIQCDTTAIVQLTSLGNTLP
jgi:hypothetical protein